MVGTLDAENPTDVPGATPCWREWAAVCARAMLAWRRSEPFQDEPMTPADWDRHLSWRRHLPEPAVLLHVILMLTVPEVWVMGVSVGVGLYGSYLQPLPGWPQLCSKDAMIIFQLTSFAVALVLVFRTNTAHLRWWEARTAVGRWLSVVRNLQRMMCTWAPPGDAALVAEFAKWNATLTTAGAAYLCTRPEWLSTFASDLLTPDDLAWVASCPNPPVAVTMVLSRLAKRSGLSAYERGEVERELVAFDNMLAACERITKQAIPLAYTRHTSRCLLPYLTFLPFPLWDYMGWAMLPAMAALSFLLLGIENIGVQIENPLRVLPMPKFCAGNKAIVMAIQNAHETAAAVADARLAAVLAGKSARCSPPPAPAPAPAAGASGGPSSMAGGGGGGSSSSVGREAGTYMLVASPAGPFEMVNIDQRQGQQHLPAAAQPAAAAQNPPQQPGPAAASTAPVPQPWPAAPQRPADGA